MKIYADLTKFGIVIFTLIAGMIGYLTSYSVDQAFSITHVFHFLAGLYFISSGSLALNQVQEYKLDQKMKRTSKRPIASGKMKPIAALILSVALIITGIDFLSKTSDLAATVGVLSVILYNGLYTYILKPKWIFGAVPGAIPGAFPVTIGYVANSTEIFSLESIYLFLIMFLWQMPHFWLLAIKYKDDYASGGIPTLPVAMGIDKTIYYIGVYLFAYIGVALAAPFFVTTYWIYILGIIPISIKMLWDFKKYFSSKGESHWLSLFLYINLSMIIYLLAAVEKLKYLFNSIRQN